ncbi:pyrimidine utilization protein D [Novosphingobium sp. JCM 18896]|uniref:pyrimidine utilization protein D n=1 Tax=Novosphingobium sp. JCM 18896 TaxID=2989731 RepID=UPI002223AA70|nr:pyrimidine utilization protein D [Novosphingobium sp. JCM 18896]MCW1429535.1 pyrimidine utilization protein D [Novosphingobium sp. JCM 18896]
MAEAAELYYELHGAPDAPPLILSSGLGGSASYWAPNIPALAERFRVIAYDHRGTGRSDRALPDETTLADLGTDMLSLMDALGIERAHLLGHAIGGMAALEVARIAPSRVDRLVVINGWPRLDPQTARCFSTRLTLLRTAGARAYLEAQPLFLFPPTWLSENDARLTADTETHLAHWPGDATMEKRIAAARSFDCTGWVSEIAAPVLLISAADDLLVPWTNAPALAELIADAFHLHLPWGGHACNVTVPEPFNRDVCAWLAGEAPPFRS